MSILPTFEREDETGGDSFLHRSLLLDMAFQVSIRCPSAQSFICLSVTFALAQQGFYLGPVRRDPCCHLGINTPGNYIAKLHHVMLHLVCRALPVYPRAQ